MQVTDSLSLAVPVRDGIVAYHTPISRQVYEAHYAALNATKAHFLSKGNAYLMATGPSIANLVLKDESERDAMDRGTENQSEALLGEIKRLTTVLVPGAHGYDQIPIDAAISQGKIDSEDWSELEAAIVFFTCLVATAKKAMRQRMANSAAGMLSGSITSSPPMEFAASLQTSTKAEPTPATPSLLPV